MVMERIAMLCAVSVRTFAYLQAMKQANLYPSMCFVLAEDKEDCAIGRENSQLENQYFEVEANLIEFLASAGFQYHIIGTRDANSDEVFEKMETCHQDLIIYSGYGGCILDKRLFGIHKKFIHVHAGLLPRYRGSTTAYYSILEEGFLGATGMFMNEKIDEGEILLAKSFPVPKDNVSIDYIYEPWIRAQVLIMILKRFCETGKIESRKQEGRAETYYIIHPVLKHIALLSMEKAGK